MKEVGSVEGALLPDINQKSVDGSKIEEVQMEGGDGTLLETSKNNLVMPSPMSDVTMEKPEAYCRLSLISGEKIKEAIESYNFMQDLLTSIKSERTFNKLTIAQVFLMVYVKLMALD